METDFQFGRLHQRGIAWETELTHRLMSIRDFYEKFVRRQQPQPNDSKQLSARRNDVDAEAKDQSDNDADCEEATAQERLHPSTHWGYASYKHMQYLFSAHQEAMEMIDWSCMGIAEDGKRSTFWFGTAGARTQCHYDTYGWNIVAQLHGRKAWTLFPPSDTANLYPTRVPYEESSVFSRVNIDDPNFDEHGLFRQAKGHVVVLQPGDVLYVPRHWWHHVVCLDAAVSVNLWMEDEGDSQARLHEALVRLCEWRAERKFKTAMLDCDFRDRRGPVYLMSVASTRRDFFFKSDSIFTLFVSPSRPYRFLCPAS